MRDRANNADTCAPSPVDHEVCTIKNVDRKDLAPKVEGREKGDVKHEGSRQRRGYLCPLFQKIKECLLRRV